MQLSKVRLILISLLGLFFASDLYAQFAHKINRNRRYDEISWLINHNANNNRSDGPGFICFGGGNQDRSIQQQLQDGIRSFMVDMYRVHGALRLKHGPTNTCMMDAKKFNNVIANWLETHPLDIITLHIESGPNLGKSGLDDIFFGRRSGYKNMSSFIYNHKTFVSAKRPRNSGADVYPTVNEMLAQKKQLVIFTERNYNSDLYRYEFQATVQNEFRASQVNQLFDANKFVRHRGIDHKTVLTVNHFAGDAPTYNGDKNKSRDANKDVWGKAVTAWYMFGHRPSIAVDYHHLSNGRNALAQIDDVNKINEVRGRFINTQDSRRHVRDVKTYLAEFKNGRWQKIKNNEHRGRRAAWHVFYSFPARVNDNRAIFFEHPNYTFSPSHVKVGDYDGNNSRTYVKNISATPRNSRVTQQDVSTKVETKVVIYPNPIKNQQLNVRYLLESEGEVTLEIFDLLGRKVGEILKPVAQTRGRHQVIWKPQILLQGVYVIRGNLAGQAFTKRIIFN